MLFRSSHVTNAPTEAVNLIKRIKRVGFGFPKFAYYRGRHHTALGWNADRGCELRGG